MEINIKEISYEASLKWWGLLAKNNIHLSTRFLKKRGFYNVDDDKFYIIKLNELSVGIRVTFSKGCYISTNKKILNTDEIIQIIQLSKKLMSENSVNYNTIFLCCENNPNEINDLGYVAEYREKDICFTHNIDFELFDEAKITRRQIKRWLPLTEVREIKTEEDLDKLETLFKEWLEVKKDDGENAGLWGNLALGRVKKDMDNYTIMGVFIGEAIIGYRAYRNINNETKFIMLENVISSKMLNSTKVEEYISELYKNKYGKSDNSANRLIRNNAKSLCLYLYYGYEKINSPNTIYYNIDGTGSKDKNLFEYKKSNFEIQTNVLTIKIR